MTRKELWFWRIYAPVCNFALIAGLAGGVLAIQKNVLSSVTGLKLIVAWVLALVLLCAIGTSRVAASKRRDPLSWAMAGFFFGWIALKRALRIDPDD